MPPLSYATDGGIDPMYLLFLATLVSLLLGFLSVLMPQVAFLPPLVFMYIRELAYHTTLVMWYVLAYY